MSDKLYVIKDSTLTALGDAVRSKAIGTTELPIITVENQYVDYNKAYGYEMPIYVKKVKINGFLKFPYNSETFNVSEWDGTEGLGVAPGKYGTYDEDLVRENSDYTIVWHPYPAGTQNAPVIANFETIVEGNAWAFVATKAYNGPQKFYITYTAIGLDENGNEFKYAPLEMVDAINELNTIPMEAFIATGNCYSRFGNGTLDWMINLYGDKITTKDITSSTYMFADSSVEYIPFAINFKLNSSVSIDSMFHDANNLKELPIMNDLKPSSMSQAFYNLFNIRDVAEDVVNNWDFDYLNNSTGSVSYFFNNAHSLRKIPKWHQKCWSKTTSSYSSPYYNRYAYCYVLDEVKDLPITPASYTTNMCSGICNSNWRITEITFETNEDGTAKTANWKSQTIDLSNYIGFYSKSYKDSITKYNSGITADKEVTDDATYQALKNDPDWFSCDINYSRYNHDSAVNTINSLPDCSATGTNTIKFKGASGALTDGGAINTLTEEEIAVATAKGWTITFS